MPIGAYTEVAAPRVEPLPYGLLSIAQYVPEGDPHWRTGSWFQPDACGPAGSTQDDCPNPAFNFIKPPTTVGIVARGANAFTAYTYIDCSPVGHWDDYEARTSKALALGAPRILENVFWTGKTGVPVTGAGLIYPHLASNAQVLASYDSILLQPAAVVVSGSGSGGLATSITEAVGILEESMGACYPGIPTIHVPRRAIAHLTSHFFVNTQGNFLNLPSGTKVNAGGGNPNVGPDGSTPPLGQFWMYATGQVAYRSGEIRFTSTENQALRRDVNSMRLIAEQVYQFNWDCCLFAILVDLTGNN